MVPFYKPALLTLKKIQLVKGYEFTIQCLEKNPSILAVQKHAFFWLQTLSVNNRYFCKCNRGEFTRGVVNNTGKQYKLKGAVKHRCFTVIVRYNQAINIMPIK